EKPASVEYTRRLEKLGVPHVSNYKFEYLPVGCPTCESTGYKGRVGIYEMLLTEGSVREAIHMNARSDEILGLARAGGFRSLQEHRRDSDEETRLTGGRTFRIAFRVIRRLRRRQREHCDASHRFEHKGHVSPHAAILSRRIHTASSFPPETHRL